MPSEMAELLVKVLSVDKVGQVRLEVRIVRKDGARLQLASGPLVARDVFRVTPDAKGEFVFQTGPVPKEALA